MVLRGLYTNLSNGVNNSLVIRFYPSAFKNLCKNSFPRHHTIACLIINIASFVADLSYLADLHFNFIADNQPCSYRQACKFNPLNSKILCKISGIHIQAELSHLINRLYGKQANLPVPLFACVRITLKSEVFFYKDLVNILLSLAFFFAYAYCDYLAFHCKNSFHPSTTTSPAFPFSSLY